MCTIAPTRDWFSNQRIIELNAYIKRMALLDDKLHCIAPSPCDVKKHFNFDRNFGSYIHFNLSGKRYFVNNLVHAISKVQSFRAALNPLPP